jgi:glycogen phosphorylase/synthase
MTFFEVSFEVCNKVGGIYTVVSSKIPFLTKALAQKYIDYFCIGPYFSHSLREFKELPLSPILQQVSDVLRTKGIVVHYGTWLIEGSPQCILLDFSQFYHASDEFKGKLYRAFDVDSLHAGFDYTEPLTFSHAVGFFIQTYIRLFDEQRTQSIPASQTSICQKHMTHIVHSHEWMCGFTNLFCLLEKIPIQTVFTTHATILARASFGNGIDFFSNVKNPQQAQALAKQLGVFEKYSVERACITASHVSTTVSQITAMECEAEFGKKPFVIYNGLNINAFGTIFTRFEKKMRARSIIQTIAQSICPGLKSNARYVFTSGRFETHNKGFDVIIEALSQLQRKYMISKKMIYTQTDSTTIDSTQSLTTDLQLVCFFFVPSQHTCVHPHIRANLTQIQPMTCIQQLTTHDCSSNQLVELCLSKGLINSSLSPVKVVIVPAYVGVDDNLFSRSYYDVTSAFDVGVFPSMYEPFGYTPLESCATAAYTLTTDYTGFGESVATQLHQSRQQHIDTHLTIPEPHTQGIHLLSRKGLSDSQFALDLAHEFQSCLTISDELLLKRAIEAFIFAQTYDWSSIGQGYLRAYGLLD